MRILILLIIFILITFSCSSPSNIFSSSNPDNSSEVYDADTLISMGDTYLSKGEYQKAFEAYQRALELSPSKSKALWGVSISYILLNLPSSNIIQAVINQSYTNLAPLNTLYNVSYFVSSNLFKIINKEADGEIPYDDYDVNLNFYIFNNFYSIFDLLDSNTNFNIQNDTNDVIVISSDFQIDSNNSKLFTTINHLQGENPNPFYLLEIPPLIGLLAYKYSNFSNNIEKSEIAISNVYTSLESTNAKALLEELTSGMRIIVSGIEDGITGLSSLSYNSNTNFNLFSLTNIYEITNIIQITNFQITNNDMVTNYLQEAGYGTNDYDKFTNDLAQAGITNVEELTNIVPGLSNISEILSNYFNQ